MLKDRFPGNTTFTIQDLLLQSYRHICLDLVIPCSLFHVNQSVCISCLCLGNPTMVHNLRTVTYIALSFSWPTHGPVCSGRPDSIAHPESQEFMRLTASPMIWGAHKCTFHQPLQQALCLPVAVPKPAK